MRKRRTKLEILILFISLLALVGLFYFLSKDNTEEKQASKPKQDASALLRKNTAKVDLPNVKASDWELVLVNRDNPKEEMNPDLTTVDTIEMDQRIAQSVTDFLAAAQEIDPQVHLISGYRSVEYQTTVYNGYVEQEMAARGIDQAAAEKIVQTYSQPPGSSEHQTGLAIDMSAVDSLNEEDATVAKKLAEIAPNYGFVLRFTEEKKRITGIGYEDWHFRYVGVESARYMTEHNLALEEYIKELKEAGKE